MAAKWTVTRQEQREDLNNGRFIPVMVVSFQVENDMATYSVNVPVAQYSADRVREVVQEYADRIHTVNNL